MRISRPVAVVGALAVVAAVVAGSFWYRARAANDAALARACDGMLPAGQAARFTHDDATRLDGEPVESGYSCRVGRQHVQIAWVPDGTRHALDALYPLEHADDGVPVPLGGGWHGFTDRTETGVTLACTNRRGSLAVFADTTALAPARTVAGLVTAVAGRAAAHYRCHAPLGGRIPPVPPAPPGKPTTFPDGACRGLPLDGTDGVLNWQRPSPGSGSVPLESCLLGWRVAPNSATTTFRFTAAYGPYATRDRYSTWGTDDLPGRGGHRDGTAWTTARCPGTGIRALYWASSEDERDLAYLPHGFLTAALHAFAERSAHRHGCTDVAAGPAPVPAVHVDAPTPTAVGASGALCGRCHGAGALYRRAGAAVRARGLCGRCQGVAVASSGGGAASRSRSSTAASRRNRATRSVCAGPVSRAATSSRSRASARTISTTRASVSSRRATSRAPTPTGAVSMARARSSTGTASALSSAASVARSALTAARSRARIASGRACRNRTRRDMPGTLGPPAGPRNRITPRPVARACPAAWPRRPGPPRRVAAAGRRRTRPVQHGRPGGG